MFAGMSAWPGWHAQDCCHAPQWLASALWFHKFSLNWLCLDAGSQAQKYHRGGPQSKLFGANNQNQRQPFHWCQWFWMRCQVRTVRTPNKGCSWAIDMLWDLDCSNHCVIQAAQQENEVAAGFCCKPAVPVRNGFQVITVVIILCRFAWESRTHCPAYLSL